LATKTTLLTAELALPALWATEPSLWSLLASKSSLLTLLTTETLLAALLATKLTLLPTLLASKSLLASKLLSSLLTLLTLLTAESLLAALLSSESLLSALRSTKALASLLTAELLSSLRASLWASRRKFGHHIIVNDELPKAVDELLLAGIAVKVLVNPFHSILGNLSSNHCLNPEFLESFIEEVAQFL